MLLLFQKAGMARHTLPFAVSEDPGIGEATDVVVELAMVGAFGVISPCHNCGSPIKIHFHVLVTQDTGLELGVPDIGQKLLAIAHRTVPVPRQNRN